MTNDVQPSASCEKCSQIIRNPEFPKCMYCGHPIPQRDRLDPESAKQLLLEKDEERRKRQEQDRKSNSDWGYKKYRESGGYDDDDSGLNWDWNWPRNDNE